MQRSDLPFGSEFSPAQIDVRTVLEMAEQASGDWRVFENLVRAEYFEGHNTSEYNRSKLANNTKLSMIAYGIIDRDANLTELGERLYRLRTDESLLYSELARHILVNLNGLAVVQCVRDLQAAGEQVHLISLRTALEERGLHFPRGGRHPSTMRLWLEKAGVFHDRWQVDEHRLQELVGMPTADIEALMSVTPEQRAYLRAIASVGESGPFASNDIEKLASATYGVHFNEKNLPKTVLYPLRDAGFIVLERGTVEPGRGAKPFMVTATEKLVSDVAEPLLRQAESQTGAELRALLRRPFKEIVADLDAPDRLVRGLALEALAFKLMRLIDLTYVATRLRGSATSGAEVDLIFESARLMFSRWQIQCKNTSRVALDDIAKEVGLTHALKSNVIVIASTGTVGSEARRYASGVMRDSNLCIILVDGKDIRTIQDDPSAIVDIFNREARQAMKLKALEL
ncbi:MAG: restriction endonuclease [Anaerolineae bacterium]